MLPTTGPQSLKPYQCVGCGAEEEHKTNHWRDIYPMCRHCHETHWICLEPPPEGYAIPEKWKKIKVKELFHGFVK